MLLFTLLQRQALGQSMYKIDHYVDVNIGRNREIARSADEHEAFGKKSARCIITFYIRRRQIP